MRLRKAKPPIPEWRKPKRPNPITSSPNDWRKRVAEEYADRPQMIGPDGGVIDTFLNRSTGGTLPCGHAAHIWDDPEKGYTIDACFRCNWQSYDSLYDMLRFERSMRIYDWDRIEKLKAENERLSRIEARLPRTLVRRAIRWVAQTVTRVVKRTGAWIAAVVVKSYERVIPPPCQWCGEKPKDCDCAKTCCEHCHELNEDCKCYCEKCGDLLDSECQCCPEDCECRECMYG